MMPHPVVKDVNRDNDLHIVLEQEASLDQLDLRKLLFIGRVGTSCLPCHEKFSSIFYLYLLKKKTESRKWQKNKQIPTNLAPRKI